MAQFLPAYGAGNPEPKRDVSPLELEVSDRR